MFHLEAGATFDFPWDPRTASVARVGCRTQLHSSNAFFSNKEGEMNRYVLSVSRCLIPAFVTACWATASPAQGGPPPFVSGQVTVTNSSTNPVPNKIVNSATAPAIISSIDDPARIPYAANASATCGIQCDILFPAVPAGHRLVVQNITGFAGFTSTPQSVLVAAAADLDSKVSYFIVPSAMGNQGAFSGFNQPVLMYLDAGQKPHVTLQAAGTGYRTIMVSTVTGYLVDCAANQCAPIVPAPSP
jgi:hypothetical protein